jgi:hypothetical protein
MTTPVGLRELKYIKEYGRPIWSGLVNGRDEGVNKAVRNGYLEKKGGGFWLTEKAHKIIEASVCPCCGQNVKTEI